MNIGDYIIFAALVRSKGYNVLMVSYRGWVTDSNNIPCINYPM